MDIEKYITLASYLSSLGFLIGTILMTIVVHRFGKSTLGAIFSYILVGTGVFVFISIFLGLGSAGFNISDESVDIWWHILFYMGFIFYFFGLKLLASLGSADSDPNQTISQYGAKIWGVIGLFIIAFVFIAPPFSENVINIYTSSKLNSIGLHHLIAFALAGTVASYLLSVKRNLGQIGHAIANPIILAVSSLSLQHLWELLNESLKVINVGSNIGEGVEKIFLIVASLAIIWASLRLMKFTRV